MTNNLGSIAVLVARKVIKEGEDRETARSGAGATIFLGGAALALSSAPGKTAMLRRLVIKLCSVHSIHSY